MAAPTPATNQGDRRGQRGPTTSSAITATAATNATCGFASNPIPVTMPAINSAGPDRLLMPRISSQPTMLVLSMSKVVVVT
jgi:hypothetical protein